MMRPRKLSLHRFLFVRAPLALAICASLFLLTLFFTPLSALYLAITATVGLILSVISIDELTEGRTLSWLDYPLLLIGGYAAEIVSFRDTHGVWLALVIQYLLLVFSVELAVIIIFRQKIERFCRRSVAE
jgi:hypothetical protein